MAIRISRVGRSTGACLVITATAFATGIPLASQAPAPSGQLLLALAADAAQLHRMLDGMRDGTDDAELLDSVEQLYRGRDFRLLWIHPDRRAAARVFVTAMRRASEHGLPPRLFRPDRWQRAFAGSDGTGALSWPVASDIGFTLDLLRFAKRLALGSDPGASLRTIDVVQSIAGARDAAAAHRVLRALTPVHPGYHRLRRALVSYAAIASAGGWPSVASDLLLIPEEPIEAGTERSPQTDEQTADIRAVCLRLAATGDLPGDACAAQPLSYHAGIVEGVRRFQQRHGLHIDGVVGPNTAAAMNVTADERVTQIATNLDRWRRLPDDLGERHVRVNIAGFQLEAREAGVPVLTMRVVAGEPETPTPVFSDEIAYLVFRPYWNVPRSITTGELLPQIARDRGYLRRNGFEVVDGWEEPARIVNPSTVDWTVAPSSFPYRLRQRPGPANSLGLVKFMFPNRYNVYLHDTPATHRFEQRRRAFSHGCVRVEDPVSLAAFLLRDQAAWSSDAVRAAMHGSTRQVVYLSTPVPVHLTYFTSWARDGRVQFRPDVYKLDRDAGSVEQIITAFPPTP